MKCMIIFNFNQSQYLLRKGCVVNDCGYGKIDHKPYLNFICDETFDKYMTEWRYRNKK